MAKAAKGAPPRVLVVHGRAAIAELAERALRAWGFEPVLTDDPERATWMAAELVPSAVVLDLAIPRFDALDLAEALRGHPRTQALPIVAVLEDAATDAAEYARARGCDVVVSATVDGHRLAAEIEQLVAEPPRSRAA